MRPHDGPIPIKQFPENEGVYYEPVRILCACVVFFAMPLMAAPIQADEKGDIVNSSRKNDWPFRFLFLRNADFQRSDFGEFSRTLTFANLVETKDGFTFDSFVND